MDLFAVLDSLDGMGIPLEYLFVERVGSNYSTVSGNLAKVLVKILEKLRLSRFSPSVVGCDVDKSGIDAIQEVWPSTNIQLYFWHA